MAEGSKVCPYCRRLNGAAETDCYNCGRRLPGKAASAGLSAYRSMFGGELPVTRLFIALCVVVFALAVITSGSSPPIWGETFARSELLRWGAIGGQLGRIEPWRYLSAVFVHLNLVHLGLNMLSLVYLGRTFEQQVGSGRLALLFVVTGILGFVVSDVWYSARDVPNFTAGASGSLFGLMGALIGWMYSRRDPEWKNVALRFAVYAAAFAFTLPVNNAAHLGGFAAGFPLGYLLQRERRPDLHHRTFGVVAVVLIALSVGSVLLSVRSPLWRELRQLELQEELERES
jgi:membrane associated rhomboid family serine protease